MWDYTKSKLTSWWQTLRGDFMLALAGLLAAYIASQYDWLGIGNFPGLGPELVIAAYFLMSIFLFFGIVALMNGIKFAIFSDRVRIELKFSSLHGRVGFGRYLVVYIYNDSTEDLDLFSIILLDVREINGKWDPPADQIARRDEFLWGTSMVKVNPIERIGKKKIKKNDINDYVVDLLHTGWEGMGEFVKFTLQYVDNIIAPMGNYEFDVELRGIHMMKRFSIPLTIKFKYAGEMEITEIEVINEMDNRIKEICLSYDNEVTVIKK